MEEGELRLAEWRRTCGTWEMTFVVEGFDELSQHIVRGDLNPQMALAIGTKQCARKHKCKQRYVHLKELKRGS